MTVNVWLAGSAANADDFQKSPFMQLGIKSSDVTSLYVSSDGKIIKKVNESKDIKNIGVGFLDNRFTEQHLEDNPNLLDNLLMYEYREKRFDSINLIGHSNGGNVITRWVERFSMYRPFKVNNIVTICTPFNGYVKSAKPTGFLKEVLANKNKLNGINKKAFMSVVKKPLDFEGKSYKWDTVVTLDNAYTGEQVFGGSIELINSMPDGSEPAHMKVLSSPNIINYLKGII